MDCCGHTNDLVPHSFALGMPLASVGAMLAGEVGPVGSTEAARTAETAAAALEVLRRSISVDVHSHGGNTGISSKAPPNGDLAKAIDDLVAAHGMRRALNAADLEAAHQAGEPAIIADVEGLDFLDGKLERLEEAHRRGIRHAQLVHYTPNDIGHFQTGSVTHHGLTEFGAEVIRACHRLGLVCDVAHATEEMAKQSS